VRGKRLKTVKAGWKITFFQKKQQYGNKLLHYEKNIVTFAAAK
jgi:hypothetical protein